MRKKSKKGVDKPVKNGDKLIVSVSDPFTGKTCSAEVDRSLYDSNAEFRNYVQDKLNSRLI